LHQRSVYRISDDLNFQLFTSKNSTLTLLNSLKKLIFQILWLTQSTQTKLREQLSNCQIKLYTLQNISLWIVRQNLNYRYCFCKYILCIDKNKYF
jgi:hypothetical protein